MIRSGQFSNSFEILSMSTLFASFRNIRSKLEKLWWWETFSLCKSMGPSGCYSNQSIGFSTFVCHVARKTLWSPGIKRMHTFKPCPNKTLGGFARKEIPSVVRKHGITESQNKWICGRGWRGGGGRGGTKSWKVKLLWSNMSVKNIPEDAQEERQ